MGFDALYVLIQTVVVFGLRRRRAGHHRRDRLVADRGGGDGRCSASCCSGGSSPVHDGAASTCWCSSGSSSACCSAACRACCSGCSTRPRSPSCRTRFFASFNAVDPQLLTLSAVAVGASRWRPSSGYCTVLDVLALGASHGHRPGRRPPAHRAPACWSSSRCWSRCPPRWSGRSPSSACWSRTSPTAWPAPTGTRACCRRRCCSASSASSAVSCCSSASSRFDTALRVVIEFVGGIVFLVLVLQEGSAPMI